MATQINLFDNYSKYFELFQEQNDYSKTVLEKAKQIKESIQEVYKNVVFNESSNNHEDVWVLDFDAVITQVSEQPSRDSLKLFTRQYTPIVRIYKNGSLVGKLNYEVAFKETDKETGVEIKKSKNPEVKYIHKYINELFIGDNISQEYFFDVAQQYFLLDFVYKQIKNEESVNKFVQKIKKLSDNYEREQQTIICVNCKLRGRNMPDNINPNLYSAISHINTLWDNLSKQQNYIIIGNYINYLTENELIKQLNNNESPLVSETISDYFQNDFLLLNNMEFMNEKPYTNKWDNRIFAPLLLEKQTDKYCLKNIDYIKGVNNQIFLFQKTKPDEKFYKTEIYVPHSLFTHDIFTKSISLSMDSLKLKLQEEK